MRKTLILFLLIAVSMCAYAAFNKPSHVKLEPIFRPEKIKANRIGETITYYIQLGKMNIGKAIFRHLPNAELKGRIVSLITFETKVGRFTDLEKIYSDPESFLPLKVERSVSTWPLPEKITEDYDQEKFVLTIKKVKGGRENEFVIKKDNVINNAILLPYFVRDTANLDIGYNLIARLPTREFLVELVEKAMVEIPAGKFMAYRFKSKPEKFEIWISADERKVPIKIKGTSGLGYVFAMQEYSQN
jgi:hypothetical protein